MDVVERVARWLRGWDTEGTGGTEWDDMTDVDRGEYRDGATRLLALLAVDT